jgi:hypothetical protein
LRKYRAERNPDHGRKSDPARACSRKLYFDRCFANQPHDAAPAITARKPGSNIGPAPTFRKVRADSCFPRSLARWLAADPMFQAKATDDGARGAIALAIVFMAIDLVVRIRRRRTLPRAPHPVA